MKRSRIKGGRDILANRDIEHGMKEEEIYSGRGNKEYIRVEG